MLRKKVINISLFCKLTFLNLQGEKINFLAVGSKMLKRTFEMKTFEYQNTKLLLQTDENCAFG